MHRIDDYGNVAGMFTEGDPGQAIPATKVTDDWLNAVQEELCGVIEGLGDALNKASNGQLLTALKDYIDGVGAWTDLPLVNGWVAHYPAPAQYKKVGGRVWLNGAIRRSSGTSSVAWSELPAGYRPRTNSTVLGFASGSAGAQVVAFGLSVGSVNGVGGYVIANGDPVYIDGISYVAES